MRLALVCAALIGVAGSAAAQPGLKDARAREAVEDESAAAAAARQEAERREAERRAGSRPQALPSSRTTIPLSAASA